MKRLIMAAFFLLTASATALAAETPPLHDFARMMPLTLSGTGALHEVSLPSEITPLPAQAGASVEAGGKQALKPRIPATTWRKALLWGALLLGVIVLAGMVWRLVKEMRADDVRKN